MGTPTSRREERFTREGERTAPRRRARPVTSETRPAFKTTEFYAFVALSIGVLIAGLVADGAGGINAWQAWLIVGIITSAYVVSRGLAKAGNAERWVPGRDDDDIR